MKIEKYNGPHTSYSEVPQTNVLRWTVLFNQGDGVFKPQTKEFKCKDFFNELVAKYHGHVLGCYGFTTESSLNMINSLSIPSTRRRSVSFVFMCFGTRWFVL